MVILENIDIDIDIDKAILQNIDIDKISNRFKFGISNRASWFEENINLRRKGRTDKEKKENIWPKEEKKNRKEKKQIFGQRKYLVHGGEKERRRKRRKIFGDGKSFANFAYFA